MSDDQDQCMRLAAPLLRGVYDVLYDAVAMYQGGGYSDEVRAEHSDRGAANCVYDHAEKAMVRYFDGMKGVNFLNIRGLFVLNYLDLVVLRWKKVKPSGRHRNYPTQQQRDYDDQLPLPDLPEAAKRLTAGYQLDAGGTAIERVMIARPRGRSVDWTAQIIIVNDEAKWIDITPPRFAGTERTDFDAERARRRR